ncbi:hypothetical protein CTAYLR_003613 [Chrysophaeum taylorii]|uniref:50S ribosomal protein L22, chloroplastic n=1 Tax=Chrysophaeum taylorii TaxID=2483200 RepID=A0AAD7UCF9_9STRA|nr:hypothetical protein CTAYLR_003613 [Chrysophaeum taylorii]
MLGVVHRRLAMARRGAPIAWRLSHSAPKNVMEASSYVERSVRTSPFRLNLIAGLVRRMWVPEALTQLKFLNKRFAPVVAAAVEKAAFRAGTQHELVPEELQIERCFVTPASFLKRIKIHGKGRHGIMHKRSGHINVTVAKIDFDQRIADAKNHRQKRKWQTRKEVAWNARVRVLGDWADKRMFPPKGSESIISITENNNEIGDAKV